MDRNGGWSWRCARGLPPGHPARVRGEHLRPEHRLLAENVGADEHRGQWRAQTRRPRQRAAMTNTWNQGKAVAAYQAWVVPVPQHSIDWSA